MPSSRFSPWLAPTLAGLALLAGCATPQERAARMQAEMARLIEIYGPACVQLGYTVQTDPWRQCVLQLSTREEIERMGPPYYGGRPYWRGYWGPYW